MRPFARLIALLLLSAPVLAGTETDEFCFPVNLPIPDGGQVVSEVGIDAGQKCPLIDDLNLVLDIAHTRVGDLRISLGYDSGAGSPHSEVVLDRPGVPDSTSGCEGDDILAVIDDEATTAAEFACSATPPAIEGSVIGGDPPDANLLLAFAGDSPCGNWRLTVEDLADGDSGNLNEWCFQYTIASDDGDVPATGHPAVVTLALLMLVSLAWLARRRA